MTCDSHLTVGWGQLLLAMVGALVVEQKAHLLFFNVHCLNKDIVFNYLKEICYSGRGPFKK